MGAQTSAQRDEKSQEDASAEELSAEVNVISEGDSVVDSKLQQKNGQISISRLNGKRDEQTGPNDHSEDNTLAEEVDGVTVSQKEEVPETMDSAALAPQVNGEKEETETPDSNITGAEEKEIEDKPGDANEVGFKKIFKFVGFKFTLKKDKNEKTDPVQLLTVKDKEAEGETSGSEETKEEAATGEEVKSDEHKVEPEIIIVEADTSETRAEAVTPVEALSETVDGDATEEVTEDAAEEKEAEEKEAEDPALATATQAGQEANHSPFRRFFTQGIFSNLRKKASMKKPKEEEPKDKAAEEEINVGVETADAVVGEEVVNAKEEVQGEPNELGPVATPVEAKPESAPESETAEALTEEIKKEVQTDVAVETSEATITDDAKPVDEKVKDAVEVDKAPVAVTTESEVLSSQEKVKAQGSPLKKLFTGAGLKKLSTKKPKKEKKDAEAKLTESGEQVAEQVQTSTESADFQKPESGASSPEESGVHAIGVEAAQAEASQEADGEVSSSDEGKKKEGIMPWSSFKKMVTPKKRVKRPSESEDEAAGEKTKSATLSSNESAVFMEKEKEEEPEPTEEEPKTENTEKLESSTEEHKKMKMDTSVSWEALMCMGGNKKRTRKTSDSEDEETKIEEKAPPALEDQAKSGESPLCSSGEADQENTVSSPEPSTSPTTGESTWDTLKRLVIHRKKPKPEDKTDESGGEQIVSDSEIPKEESSFSLRKLIPGRRKKKQLSLDLGSGEEDSDTPAVVPLSEYYSEPTEPKDSEPEMSVETVDAVDVEPISQAQSSIEERSPSWISATAVVENLQEILQDQLSDIPEEGAATPKSADTTITEDIVEQTSEAVTCQEQEPELSVAEVTADSVAESIVEKTSDSVTCQEQEPELSVAEVTADSVAEDIVEQSSESVKCQEPELSVAEINAEMILTTHEETTPLPSEPEPESLEVLQEAVEVVSDLPSLTSGEITQVQLEAAASVPELTPEIEFAESKSKVVLMVHEQNEVTAICTGLSTKKMEEVAVENTMMPIVESLAEMSNALSIEMPLEHKADTPEVADPTEDPVFEAQVEQVKSTFLEKPPENTVEDIPEHEIATEDKEPEVEKVATVNDIRTETEIIEAQFISGNTPKVELVDPIATTVENSIPADIVEVSEALVAEFQSKEMEVEETAAVEENSAVEEVNEPATRELLTSLTDANQAAVKECEANVAVVAPAEEFAIVKETVCFVSSPSESIETQQVEVTDAAVIETLSVAVAEPAGDDQIQVQVTEVGRTEAEETKEEGAMEETGLVIAQVVIQSSLKKVSEAEAEPNAPTATTTTEDSLPVQAVAAIEEEIEHVTEEKPVITETPVIQVEAPAPDTPAEKPATPETSAKTLKMQKEVHEAVQVIETVPVTVEITESIMEEVTMEAENVIKGKVEEIKLEVELKEAVEVNVSEEKVVAEIDGKELGINEEQRNVEPEEDVLQAQVGDVVQQVQEVITEVLTSVTAVEKSEVMFVTKETTVEEAPTETTEAPAQPERSIAEVLVPQTASVVIHAAQIVEEKASEEIHLEKVVEMDSIVSTLESKEAKKDALTPETIPDALTSVPDVADVIETTMKGDSSTIQELASDNAQTVLVEPQTEAVVVNHDSQVNSMEEVVVAMAATVSSTAETVEETAASVKCAEVMAQVIEVIEEAVKEIEPISTELTAAL